MSLHKIFYETNDYNGLLITDGILMLDISAFPQDGTIDDANEFDTAGIVGAESLEEVVNLIGLNDCELPEYHENDYVRVSDIGTL